MKRSFIALPLVALCGAAAAILALSTSPVTAQTKKNPSAKPTPFPRMDLYPKPTPYPKTNPYEKNNQISMTGVSMATGAVYVCKTCRLYETPATAKKMGYKDELGHHVSRVSNAPTGYRQSGAW